MAELDSQAEKDEPKKAHQKLAKHKQELGSQDEGLPPIASNPAEIQEEEAVFSAPVVTQPEPTFETLEEVEWELPERVDTPPTAAEPSFEPVAEVEFLPVARPIYTAPPSSPQPQPGKFVATAECPNCEREFPIDLRRRGTECSWCSFFVSRPRVVRQRQG